MVDDYISSPKGLIALSKVKGLPLVNNYTSSTVSCRAFMKALLQRWNETAESVLAHKKAPLPESDIDAMRIYLERADAQLDQITLCYRIIYECKQALGFLEKSERILKVAYHEGDGLEDKTILKLKRSMQFLCDDEAIAYQASYHVFQAQYFLHTAELLGSEDIIMHGQKAIKGLKNARMASSEQRNRGHDYRQWQDWANDVWVHNPSHSISAVAKIIKKKHDIPQSHRTIRDKIKKLATSNRGRQS